MSTANGDTPATPSKLTLVGKMAAASINPASSSPADGGSTRRSGRVRKAPTQFDPAPSSVSKRKRAGKSDNEIDASGSDEDEDNGDNENEGSEDSDDEDEEAESEVENGGRSTQSRKRKEKTTPAGKKTKAPPAKKPRTVTNASASKLDGSNKPKRRPKAKPNGRVPIEEEEESLYDSLLDGDDTKELARKWTKAYEENQSEAMLNLVNCILESCGCSGRITLYDIEDPDSAADKLQEIQEAFQKEQTADYPIVSKQSKFRGFKASLTSFVEFLVEHWHESSLLYNDPALIESVQVWTSAMSSSSLRPFRHTSTIISLAIITAMCKHVKENTSTMAGFTKQLEAEKKSKKKANTARITDMEKRVEEAQNKSDTAEGIIMEVYESVFVHRYRDVDPKVRTDCIHELGVWIVKLPDTFFEASYLRYLGWVLSDTSPPTRLEVLLVLTQLFKDRGNIGGLRHFTEKFRPRLVEMALKDADSNVRSAAVELLNEVRQVGFLEPEEVDSIGRLLYDSDIKVRNAVAEFFESNITDLFNDQIEEFGSLEVVTNALEESGDIENQDYEAHQLDWIKVKCLVNSLTTYDQDDGEETPSQADGGRVAGVGQETRFSLAGNALWKVVSAVKDWVQLAKYLLYDHTGVQVGRAGGGALLSRIKTFCALSAKEEAILLQILYASVESSAGWAGDSKSRKSARAEDEESISRSLAQWIPRLLNKFGPVPDAASTVLRLMPLMKLDVFQELRQTKAYASLLDDVNKQFVTHSDDSVLREASAALLHARTFDELEEVTTQKIAKLQEDVVSGLVDAARGKDLEIAALNDTSLGEIETAVKRLEYLSSIADCKEVLEHPAVSATPASKRAKGKGRRSRKSQGAEGVEQVDGDDEAPLMPLDILSAILARGVNVDDTEDELLLRTQKAISLYMMWNVQVLSEVEDIPEDDSARRQEDFETFKTRHTSVLAVLLRIVEERQSMDAVKMVAATTLVELVTLGAMVSAAAASKDVSFPRTMPQNLQSKVLNIYASAEKQFAKLTDKKLEASDEDDAEDDVDDEEDEDDEADEEQQLLYENHFCEFAGKMVLAVLWQVVDATAFKTRLERNKKHLGLNMKEILNHLETPAAKPKAKPKAKAVPGGGSRKAIKSAEMIEEGDEEDDEEEEVEDEEAAHLAELGREETLAQQDEEAMERRQATPNANEDEDMVDADD